MQPRMEPLLRALLLLQLLLVQAVRGAGSIRKSNITAIYIFGDSIVDPGNNNRRLTAAKANFPPYGQDFPGGAATGRFSNGLVPGDLLGIYASLRPHIPFALYYSILFSILFFINPRRTCTIQSVALVLWFEFDSYRKKIVSTSFMSMHMLKIKPL
jgi:hypothetical protein